MNRSIPLSSLLWFAAVGTVFLIALLKGMSLNNLLPVAGAALVPACVGLLLWPFAGREWAQMLIIFSWISLAIAACFAIAFMPMAILFLCAPAAASLFEREKVIEAMVLSAVFAGLVYYAGPFGLAPEPIANNDQTLWAGLSGVVATLSFLFGALYFLAERRDEKADPELDAKSEFAETYPGAALKFSKDRFLLMATDGALDMFGIPEDQFAKTYMDTVFSPRDQQHDAFLKAIDQAYDNAETVSMEYVRSGEEDGAATLLKLKIVPKDDGAIYVFADDCSPDFAKLQELEQSQQYADREARDKTLFFAGVSHELRTPLNAIIGFSDMMRSRLFGPLPGKYAEYADLIHDSGQHMLDLIGDVLDLSKVEAGKYDLHYDEFDAADVLRSSAKMLRPAADAAELILDIEIDSSRDLLVEADRRAVRQMVLNLLSNAIKFTPKGGRVLARAAISKDMLNIDIEDTGVGMPAHELEGVGKPYQQAANARMIKERGSGLGLSLVKNLVELHGGEFSLKSKPGVGTQACISIPVRRENS
jgi:cell cycle sensor histidine kinase DivJ